MGEVSEAVPSVPSGLDLPALRAVRPGRNLGAGCFGETPRETAAASPPAPYPYHRERGASKLHLWFFAKRAKREQL